MGVSKIQGEFLLNLGIRRVISVDNRESLRIQKQNTFFRENTKVSGNTSLEQTEDSMLGQNYDTLNQPVRREGQGRTEGLWAHFLAVKVEVQRGPRRLKDRNQPQCPGMGCHPLWAKHRGPSFSIYVLYVSQHSHLLYALGHILYSL